MANITKNQLKKIIKEEILAILKESTGAGQEMKDRIAAHQGVEPSRARSGQEVADELEASAEAASRGQLREPWDGIEANAEMIGNNAIKIEYLARALGIEIPVEPKL